MLGGKEKERQALCRYARDVASFFSSGKKSTATYPGNLHIYGDSGVGKTTAAMLMATELVREGVHVTFRRCSDLLTEISDAKSSYGDKVKDVLDRYANCAVLVIDDFADEEMPAWQVSWLYSIIDARKSNNRPTIIVSLNGDSSALMKQLGGGTSVLAAKLLRRIADDGSRLRLERKNRKVLGLGGGGLRRLGPPRTTGVCFGGKWSWCHHR